MSHFAEVINGIVQRVIVAEQEFIDTGTLGDPKNWIQTSYNTVANFHVGPDWKPDGKEPLRANYAGIGYHYDAEYDVFYPPKPHPEAKLDKTKWQWYYDKIPISILGNNTAYKDGLESS